MTALRPSHVNLLVRDQTGALIPFRAEWYMAESTGLPLDQRLCQSWSNTGIAEIELPAGPASIRVQCGFLFDAVQLDLQIPDSGTVTREVELRRRIDARSLGWYCGENHMHVLHGKNDPPRSIADGGRMAAADGLDYVQLAAHWNAALEWIPAEELNRLCRAASTPQTIVGWNIETPKCYMSEDDGGKSGKNLHCFGHGWPVNLKDNSRGAKFFGTGPNFRIMQEVHRQGGIVGCAHPIRAGFANHGTFVSNWASELPFDFVAGVPYAAVDILNDSPLLFFESERLWYNLLNLGYKVSGTGNSDGALGTVAWGLGRFRTYTQMDGGFSWEKLAAGIRDGHCIATSGPFVLFEVDGQPPGAEFCAGPQARRATLRAWSAPLPGETLVAVQLVRNGEIVRAWDLRQENTRTWETQFDLQDSEFAWYCVRVLSTCRNPLSLELWGPHLNELAVANPVYFLPKGFQRPSRAPAHLRLTVTDAESGSPLDAVVEVHDGAETLRSEEVRGADGGQFELPATASVRVSAPGYQTAERNLFMDCPELYEYTLNIGTVWPSFFSPETFAVLRQRLGNLKLAVALKRKGGGAQ